MLQSIGMTGRQLKRMLSFEGLYYAVGTIITSAVLGVLFSVVVVRGISSGIWFFTYQFVMWPMLVIYPFLTSDCGTPASPTPSLLIGRALGNEENQFHKSQPIKKE